MSTRTEPLYRLIAAAVVARQNCEEHGNTEWHARWSAQLDELERNFLPSGSGMDNGTTIDREKSSADRLVLHTSYHHMNDGGMYDGWTEHTVIVRGGLLQAIELSISGPNRNQIKEYLYDVFAPALAEEITHGYDPETDSATFTRQAADRADD